MAENSKIEWTHHTFNPWIGCQAVSPACDNCYAEKLVNGRMAGDFSQRRRTAESTWRHPLAWDRKAKAAGERHRVFCASLADVFDNKVPEQWRADLWSLITATPNLDWLLLTKRPQNIAKMLPIMWGDGWPNVWLGTTVENQTEANRRIPHLLAVPAKVRFLSCEPLLGPVDLRFAHDEETGECIKGGWAMFGAEPTARLHWVIAGGESGPGARPMHPQWARDLRDQCAESGVAYHFKQWGEWAPPPLEAGTPRVLACRGGDRAHVFPDLQQMGRIGKREAGRLLDGALHDGLPT